jgi:uncharacterized protein with PIN domain
LPIVQYLRILGHDVLTAREAGNANLQIPDEQVVAFAIAHERAVLTRNRRHFIRLHQVDPKLNDSTLVGQLIRVLRSAQ